MYTDNNYVVKKEEWYSSLVYVGKEKSVHVPAELEDDNGCFRNNKEIEEIIFTDGNKKTDGFSGCSNLKKIYFPASFETLGGWALFRDCDNLTDLEVDPNNALFSAKNGMILSKNEEKLICCAPGITGVVEVPVTVKEIEQNAFSGCKKIEAIVLPEGLEKIGNGAFSACHSLKTVNSPEKIDVLPNSCFSFCLCLETLNLSHITEIRRDAFNTCMALHITVPANVTVISENAFLGCNPDNIAFEEGAGSICAEGAFGLTIEAKKELKPYPNLPLHLFKKPEQKLWLVMGFCTAPELYSGYIQKQYEQYAKAQKKRVLKKAREDGHESVLGYYGEQTEVASPENKPDNGEIVSLSMTEAEARQLFRFSKRSAGISINEFKGINAIWKSQGVYASNFRKGVSNKVVLPEYIADKPVIHIAHTMLPENAVVFCSDLVFQKLKRPVRVSTACAYLEAPSEFPDKESNEIQKFIGRYPSDIADQLLEEGSIQAVIRFMDLTKISSGLYEEMLEKSVGRAELTALILDHKAGTKRKAKKVKEKQEPYLNIEALTSEEKPLPVSELKKLWTYSLYSTSENPDEKLVELRHYKGHEKKVVVPAKFGKYRLGAIQGLLLEEHDDVTDLILPDGNYELNLSLRNCPGLADSDGFIVIQSGARSVLTDYIGKIDAYTVRIPEGVTEIRSSVFSKMRMREVIVPTGCTQIGPSAFHQCENLQRIILPEGLEIIGQFAFNQCPVMKDIYIPASVTAIGWQNANIRVHGAAGSEAEAFANREKQVFIEQNTQSEKEPLPDMVVDNGILEKYLGKDSTVVIPEDVTVINDNAFNSCQTITEIAIPKGVKLIKKFAFMDCSELVAVHLPETVTEIDSYAFCNCRKLRNVVFSAGLKTIHENAFMWCSNLTEIIIPEGVITIGESAFDGCRELKDVWLPSSVKEIGKDAFANGRANTSLIEIHAPVGSYALAYAKENNLKYVE